MWSKFIPTIFISCGAMISACRLSVNKSSVLIAIRRPGGAGWIRKIDIDPRAMQNACEAERISMQSWGKVGAKLGQSWGKVGRG
jgi:hypothetical protein